MPGVGVGLPTYTYEVLEPKMRRRGPHLSEAQVLSTLIGLLEEALHPTSCFEFDLDLNALKIGYKEDDRKSELPHTAHLQVKSSFWENWKSHSSVFSQPNVPCDQKAGHYPGSHSTFDWLRVAVNRLPDFTTDGDPRYPHR